MNKYLIFLILFFVSLQGIAQIEEGTPAMLKLSVDSMGNVSIDHSFGRNIKGLPKGPDAKLQRDKNTLEEGLSPSINIKDLIKGPSLPLQQSINETEELINPSRSISTLNHGLDATLQKDQLTEDSSAYPSTNIEKVPVGIDRPLQRAFVQPTDPSQLSRATPNLKIYTGTGSNNTYYINSSNRLDINTSVLNAGNGVAGSFRTGFYLSTNTTITTSDELLGYRSASGLYSYYYLNQSITVDLDDYNLAEGDYYIGIYYDYTRRVSESNESDNRIYYTPSIDYEPPFSGAPNLTMYSGSGSNNTYFLSTSNVLDVSTSVVNNGSASAGSFSTGFYLSTNTTISNSDNLIGTRTQSSLTNGYYRNQSISVDLDNLNLSAGTYYIGVYYDKDSRISETSESDNKFHYTPVITYAPPGIPNLTAYSGTGSNNTYFHSNSNVLDVNTSVQNNGTGPSGVFRTGFYLSTNTTISNGDELIGVDTESNLNNGFYVNQSISVDLDDLSLSPGDYYVGIYYDNNSQVSESDENDNKLYYTPQITYSTQPNGTPNLTLYTGTGSNNTAQIYTTNYLTISASVINNGTIPVSNFRTGFYLSTNTTITTADKLVGYETTALLNNGYYLTPGTAVDLDDLDLRAGDYYVGIYIDDLRRITETDERDNRFYYTPALSYVPQSTGTPDILVNPSSLTINENSSNRQAAPSHSEPSIPEIIPTDAAFVPNQLLIKFKNRLGAATFDSRVINEKIDLVNQKYNTRVIREVEGGSSISRASEAVGHTLLVSFENGHDINHVINAYKELEIIEYAEPNYIYENYSTVSYLPDDPLFIYQWGLKNTRNAFSFSNTVVGTVGEDINVESAWDITQGSSDIVVAVLDDGVDLTHSEFAGRLVPGYDFINYDNDPTPYTRNGHGTACAGIIAAANDGLGVVGVAPNVKIMPVKVMEGIDEPARGPIERIIAGVYYAVDNGADIISMSLGGPGYSYAFNEAVNYAVANGVVVIAAAGNDNEDNTIIPKYPASYLNCISVGAMSPCGLRKSPLTCDGEFQWGSNYGDLDFIAPGVRIFTTDISGADGYSTVDYTATFNGTSSACPFAAGIAALILSANPSLSPTAVRQIMINSAVDVGLPGYDSETGYGRVDAYGALQLTQNVGTNLLTINNRGTGNLIVDNITANKSWLSTSGYSLPISLNLGESITIPVRVNWARISASDIGIISISSNDPDEPIVDIPVTVNPSGRQSLSISARPSSPEQGSVHGDGIYSYGETVTLYASSSEGHKFVGWTIDGQLVSADPVYSFIAKEHQAVMATFTSSNSPHTNEDYTPLRNTPIHSSKYTSEIITSIYPNPTKDHITIEFYQYSFSGQYELVDVLGKKVSGGNLEDKQRFQFILPDQRGVFLLKLKDYWGNTRIMKVVKN